MKRSPKTPKMVRATDRPTNIAGHRFAKHVTNKRGLIVDNQPTTASIKAGEENGYLETVGPSYKARRRSCKLTVMTESVIVMNFDDGDVASSMISYELCK